jgi:hypothetical protein
VAQPVDIDHVVLISGEDEKKEFPDFILGRGRSIHWHVEDQSIAAPGLRRKLEAFRWSSDILRRKALDFTYVPGFILPRAS